jgi:hypothetical protein
MLGAGFPELHIHFDVAEDYGNCSITLQCKASAHEFLRAERC